jgi:hypothetical protein
MHRFLIPLCALALAVAAAFALLHEPPAHRAIAATNLITNGTFDGDVAG